MYPFKYKTAIVRNRWYIAAFSNEITREPMERTLLNTPVVMYRKENGNAVAMYGICPHRYLPLAKGRVDGDNIVCGYHGFEFADTGECVKIPSQDTVSASMCQPVYPLEERGPLCWIWMGDPEKCNADLIPPYEDFGLDNPDFYYSSANYFHLKGRAQLLIDNLMDLTHLPYVHFHVPGGEAMAKVPLVIEERDISYRVVRKGKVPWNPYLEAVFGPEGAYEGLADFDIECDYYGPEFIKTSLPIITKLEGRDDVPDALGTLFILHGITPETEKSTHYFGFSNRNFRQSDKVVDDFQLEGDLKIRQQDVDTIDAVEERLDYAVSMQQELLVPADKPAARVRKKIEAMLAEENPS